VRLVPSALQHDIFKSCQPQVPTLGRIDQGLGMPEQRSRGTHQGPVDIVDPIAIHAMLFFSWTARNQPSRSW
jgi:hypothetical protein